MKKTIAAALCAVLLLSFAGCGSKSAEPAPTPIPAAEAPATEVPATQTPAAETAAPEVTPEPEAEPEQASDSAELLETVAIVRNLKDRPVAELYDAIGQPDSSDYSPSCLVSGGKDGMLYYDGFTVYTTVFPDGTEKVYDVMRPDGTDFD